MNLTDAQKEQGRRNFLKALAGTPALAALGGAAATSSWWPGQGRSHRHGRYGERSHFSVPEGIH